MQDEIDVQLGIPAVLWRPESADGVVAHDGPHAVGDPQVLAVAEQLVRLRGKALESGVAAQREEDPEPLVVPHRPEPVDVATAQRDAHPVG